MRFVPMKSASQQGVLALYRARDLLVRQRTMTANALRAHLAEFDIVAGQGLSGLGRLVALLRDPAGEPAGCDLRRRPAPRVALTAHWQALAIRIAELERRIVLWHRANETSRRLATIPDIGPITASALVASVGDPGPSPRAGTSPPGSA